jgi:beta-mannanase
MVSVFCALAIMLIIIFVNTQFVAKDTANAKQIKDETQDEKKIKDEYGKKLRPPDKGIYHGAFPSFGGTEDVVKTQSINDFESLIGKGIVWAMFSNNWGAEGIKFPEKNVKTIHNLGIVPFIRMMPRIDFREGEVDSKYTLQHIIDGNFDDKLRKWASDAKKIKSPMIVEFGPEMNGNWFPWSGILNGGGKRDGYGDAKYADGPERFKDAYRHIINLFKKEGAYNITWAFHAFSPFEKDEDSELYKKWNNIKNYYPGDDYIDWIGLSVYGAVEPDSEWTSFTEILDKAYPVIAGISSDKPLAVFEFGVAEYPHLGNKSNWIKDALDSLEAGRYPRIKAVSYWDEMWKDDSTDKIIDLRINSSIQSSQTYKDILNSSYFVSAAVFKSVLSSN